ncbi:MAG: hypothetical protein LBQ65_02505 [Tannerellaceae bacterium]|jgi:hypothetical protein|nr:hypothetical protein [Tannerellaceae bacterium]
MIKSAPLLIALCGSLALTSCSLVDFSERGCIYKGILVAHCRWDHLTEEQAAPPYTDMHLLCHTPSDAKACDATKFDAPICHRKLLAGTYDLLVYNQGDNQTRGLEEPASAEILAPVKTNGRKTYIDNEQDFVYSTMQSDVYVHEYDTTYCICDPLPLVQQITIHLVFKRMAALPELQLLKGELEGVTTSRWLASGEKGEGYATRSFTFLPTVDPRRFTTTFLVLGIKNSVENLLNLEVGLADGRVSESAISLDSALDNFVADKIEITIEIDVSSSLQLTAAIAGWIENDFGEIYVK